MIEEKIKNPHTFLIVGLGLIGGSYAKGLAQAGYTVYAIDKDPAAICYAVNEKFIQQGTTIDQETAVIEIIQKADTIILGLYPKDTVAWIKTYQQYFKSGIIITDVSGVKQFVVAEIQADLRKDIEFLASHPMAGKEVSGVLNSDPDIFLAANFIITPSPQNSKQAIDHICAIAEILKFRHIAILSPAEHDEMIGFLSQLTHVIAISLMNSNANPNLVEYTGDSFRDLTRIANINEVLWIELFLENKDVLIAQIDNFMNQVSQVRKTLVEEDIPTLKQLMIQSTQRRKKFNRK